MPDIVLNTVFNNPLLPSVPVYGFFDDFNRANTTALGVTSGEGKTWDELGGTWEIVDNTAHLTALTSTVSYPTVDALRADGTLTTTVAQIGDAAGGLVARFVDTDNWVRLSFRQSSGVNRLVLQTRVAGGSTVVAGTSAADKVTANGSVIGLVLSGSTASVTLNGETVISSVSVPSTVMSTRHGFYGASATSGIYYNDIRFTPAS